MARTHKTMRGATLDMARMRAENSTAIALGNGRMNARGDLLGANGKILKTREQLLAEYNSKNPKAVRQVNLSDESPLPDHFITPEEMIKRVQQQAKDAQAAQQVSQRTTQQQAPFANNQVARTPLQAQNTYVQPPTTSQKISEVTGAPTGKPARKRVIIDKED